MSETPNAGVGQSATASSGAFKPPWMAFATYWRFVDELSNYPLPPVIDRSMMGSKSGSDQSNLLAALRSFDQIGPDGQVTPALNAITVSDVEERKTALGALVEHYYAAPLRVSRDNGTQAQLFDCFREAYGISGGDTVRKAATFFLHAARHAGIPLSPHFPQIRAGQGAPGTRKPRKKAVKKTAAAPDSPTSSDEARQRDSEYELAVNLATGGTMTLLVSVNPLSLRGEERAFFYDIVDKLNGYREEHPAEDDADEAAS